ncbi:MAG TPA: cystatin domain-containing protein [Pyrinomonadaceae bacterium]|nr:cystatin domain-containing protein [Pyrinomonadaceae bacterium]
MKKNLQAIFIMTVFCIAFGSAVSVFGQIKTGGYRSVSISSEDVKDAADFALEIKAEEMKEELSLEGIIKAETQVVAGTNYRLCLQLYIPAKEEETDGVTLYIKTVIFKSLKNEYSITSWEEEDCAEK